MKRLTVKRHLIILFMIWTTVRWNKDCVQALGIYFKALMLCCSFRLVKISCEIFESSALKEMPWHFLFFFAIAVSFFFFFIRTIYWKGKKHFVHKVSDNIQSKKMCTSTKYCSWLLKHVQHSKNTDMDVDILAESPPCSALCNWLSRVVHHELWSWSAAAKFPQDNNCNDHLVRIMSALCWQEK